MDWFGSLIIAGFKNNKEVKSMSKCSSNCPNCKCNRESNIGYVIDEVTDEMVVIDIESAFNDMMYNRE